MSSKLLERWQTERASRLDELLSAHRLVAGPGRGRKWRTQQLNYALVLRLAVEFQGFAKELHDLASDTFAECAAGGNRPLEDVLRTRLTEGRRLSRENAQPASLGSDFGRLGFQLWAALAQREPAAERLQTSLGRLNKARNAIAHDDEPRLAELRADGFPPTLRTFHVWRRDVTQLATSLDAEVSTQLARLFGRPAPW